MYSLGMGKVYYFVSFLSPFFLFFHKINMP
jgi:hypothetical protein